MREGTFWGYKYMHALISLESGKFVFQNNIFGSNLRCNVSDINLYVADKVRRMIGAVKNKILTVVLILHVAHVTLQIIEPQSFDKRDTHNE